MPCENCVNISQANAWKSLDNWLDEFLDNNPAAREVSDKVSQELFNDGCHSAWIHRAYLIERLVEIIEEQREDLKS